MFLEISQNSGIMSRRNPKREPWERCLIPTCFKQTTIVLVPKNTKATCLNYYRHVALTPVAMKCFERLVMAHINTIIPETLDPLQFAYRPNISQMMQSLLHSTLPFPTWTKGTLVYENAIH